MLTKLIIRNFKRFIDVTVDLDKAVVFIGPNNMGKSTALQALTLWDIGLRAWVSKKGLGENSLPAKRTGVAINRKDLMSIPVPQARLLWRDLHVRESSREQGKQKTRNIRIEIIVHGITKGKEWECGLEFDYANQETFFCRPMSLSSENRTSVPEEAAVQHIFYLPPMSGLADREFVKQPGEIGFLIGQGQTAQVLRNLCHRAYTGAADKDIWKSITDSMKGLFGVQLQVPVLDPVRSEITLAYRDLSGKMLDLSCSGRGMQQVLLLLAYMHVNPGSIMLFDEPDAHLEILRQHRIFNMLIDMAEKNQSQIIAASHSEIILKEAAEKGTVVAFIGKPHIINKQNPQVVKSLRDIGYDQYYLAEQKGWVLYLEDYTDLDILRTFAKTLKHQAEECLRDPFLHPVTTNLPQRARDHFYGLREAKQDLVGIAIFDHLDKELKSTDELKELMWNRREIENYFCTKDVLIAWVESGIRDDLFGLAEMEHKKEIMTETIEELTKALQTPNKPDPWPAEIKVTDDFLDPLFKKYSEKLDIPLVLKKNEYYKLANFLKREEIPSEVVEKLEAIVEVAVRATPL